MYTGAFISFQSFSTHPSSYGHLLSPPTTIQEDMNTSTTTSRPSPAHHGAQVADADAAQQVTYGPQIKTSEGHAPTPEHVTPSQPSKSIEVASKENDTIQGTPLNTVDAVVDSSAHVDKSPMEPVTAASESTSVVPSSTHGDNVQYLGNHLLCSFGICLYVCSLWFVICAVVSISI